MIGGEDISTKEKKSQVITKTQEKTKLVVTNKEEEFA
jgi:hypothetical protein